MKHIISYSQPQLAFKRVLGFRIVGGTLCAAIAMRTGQETLML